MFDFNIDRRGLYILLAIIALYSLASLDIISILLTLPGVILAISFHEFAHAFAADRLGDTTARNQGRLTLNPLHHVEPFGIFMLIFTHIGWGRPVEVNSNNFTRNISKETGEAIVSLAGPVMNFILAILLTIVYYALGTFSSYFALTNQIGMILMQMIMYAIIVNIGLGVFNLLPIPPLDGSKIFLRFLPYKAKYWLQSHEGIIYLVFLALWITNILSYIVSPVIQVVYTGILKMVGALFGIFI